ncbi:MAG: methionyl aminopeptidase [Simkaniaceae bacterium]|nr:methionyl aminopeptidase [Simkaniaceae bacterium]
MIERNDSCWCGSEKKWKKCHFPTLPKENLKSLYLKQYQIILKTPEQIKGIRASCQLASNILKALCSAAKAGVTTNELDALAAKLVRAAGAIAAPLGYGSPPFPKSICTSLNEVICHGIPNDKPLVEGDFLNIDVTTILGGYYGDCSAMVAIGEISAEKKRIMETAYTCLMEACAILKPGIPLSKIGDVIEDIAAKQGCSVVNEFVGHGVGISFHEAPQVSHHKNSSKIPLAPGMTFTIEPMINGGVRRSVIDPRNQWEARTADGKPSAQWEHTVLITETGYELLTTIREE